MSADMIAGRRFAQSWRGYDTEEVKEFLNQVAAQVRALRERCDQAEAARRDAEQRALHPEMDESALMAAVGEETAAILRSARNAANEITGKADQRAKSMVEEAEAKAAALVADAASQLGAKTAEAESVAREIQEHALAEAEHVREVAHQQADAIALEAAQKSEEAVQGAQAIRERILSDLARRRKLGSIQVEQLRAGRERLLDAYLVVRRTLDEVTDELQRADAEARAAADAVGHQHGLGPEELVELRAEEVAGPPAPGGGEVPTATPAPPTAGLAAVLPVPTAPVAPNAARDLKAKAPGGQARPAAGPTGSPGTATAGAPTGAVLTRPDAIESVRVLRPEPAVSSPAPAGSSAASAGTTATGGPPPGAALQVGSTTNGHPEIAAGADEVQDLFARIRASRAEAATNARKALFGAEGPAGGEGAEVAAPRRASHEEDLPAAGVGLAQPEKADREDEFFQRRDEVTARLESSLARKLKRALQDEQNSLLDKLRNHKGPVTAVSVLPSPEEQPDRFVDAGRPVLEEAARAGGHVMAELYGYTPAEGPVADRDVDDLAEELGRVITEPLRQRLELAFQSASDEASEVAEALGPAYREWKTQRIEAAARDQVAAAFARGAYLSLPEGSSLRWSPAPGGAPCPDCEDNALAGAQLKGESWPTGQLYPPAHPGCGCALAIAGRPAASPAGLAASPAGLAASPVGVGAPPAGGSGTATSPARP